MSSAYGEPCECMWCTWTLGTEIVCHLALVQTSVIRWNKDTCWIICFWWTLWLTWVVFSACISLTVLSRSKTNSCWLSRGLCLVCWSLFWLDLSCVIKVLVTELFGQACCGMQTHYIIQIPKLHWNLSCTWIVVWFRCVWGVFFFVFF